MKQRFFIKLTADFFIFADMKKYLCLWSLFSSLLLHAQSDLHKAHFRPYRLGINMVHADTRMMMPVGFQIHGEYMKKDGLLDARVKLNTAFTNFWAQANELRLPNIVPNGLQAKPQRGNQYVFEASVGMNLWNKFKEPAYIVKIQSSLAGGINGGNVIIMPGCKLYSFGMHGGLGRQQSQVDYTNKYFTLEGADLYDVFDSTNNSPFYETTAISMMSNMFVFIGTHLHYSSKPEKVYHRVGYGSITYYYIDAVVPVSIVYEKVFDKLGNAYLPTIKDPRFNKFGYRVGMASNGTGYLGLRATVEFGKMPLPFNWEEFAGDSYSKKPIFNYASIGFGLHITPTKKIIEFPYNW